MNVMLEVDGYALRIDTQNAETLARWLIEQFTVIEWNGCTSCQVRVSPGFAVGSDHLWHADWIADSRIITERGDARLPEDVVAMLGRQVEAMRALSGAEGRKLRGEVS
ncbi:MAG: hypothetical protein ACYCO9_16415 [Streptosporangiaceae bacterium]